MQITGKTMKPLTEAKYLNADNVSRYRAIMRIFLMQYDKLKYKLYQEDVYEAMQQTGLFEDYRIEQCRQDLDMLTEWRNLEAYQDTRRVTSIEEFKNKKFEYSMTDVGVEVERLVQRLENLHIEGASLEPSLLERIRSYLSEFPQMAEANQENSKVYAWWNDLSSDFVRLNQNYKDYMSNLSSVKAEQMMQTSAFLAFKDQLVEYLRNFIKNLQRNVGAIEEELRRITDEQKFTVLDKVITYELSIPRIGEEVTRQEITNKIYDRYQSIFEWFCGTTGDDNEASKLFDKTNDIIRKITRYAMQISEKNAMGANRREEYRRTAEIFMKCEDMKQAHRLSAMVFGMEATAHLKADLIRETDTMNGSVYEEQPFEVTLKPRIRTYKERASRSPIRDMSREKEAAREILIRTQQKHMEKLRSLEQNGKIDFGNLPVIEPEIREILLNWLSNALEDAGKTARTDEGRVFVIDETEAWQKCVLHCTDGNMTMPRFMLIFQEDLHEDNQRDIHEDNPKELHEHGQEGAE